MNQENLCYGCMREKGHVQVCPACGWSETNNVDSSLYLTPGTVLSNKYFIGKVLGQGGFGITYLGWDRNLDIRIAIKEYFPQGLVSRVPGENNVHSYTGPTKDQFSFGLDSFLKEAKILARFEHHPNIVTVRDFFKENNTAYMVMSFIEGVTLLDYLKCNGERIPVDRAIEIMLPVLDALKGVHRAGIMHRDISPDNIFIDHEGRVILIDFGAARQEMREKSKSISVILKAGYAPPEQYQSRGRQGPWTDIYAVAATLYRCITGQVPPDSMDRFDDDKLIAPSELGVNIKTALERVILKALSVRSAERFQDIETMQRELLLPQSTIKDNTTQSDLQLICERDKKKNQNHHETCSSYQKDLKASKLFHAKQFLSIDDKAPKVQKAHFTKNKFIFTLRNYNAKRIMVFFIAAIIFASIVVLYNQGPQWLINYYKPVETVDSYEQVDEFLNENGNKGIVYEIIEGDIKIENWQPMQLIIPAINVDLITVGGGSVFDKALLDKGPTHFNDLSSMGLNVLGDLPNTERGNVAFAGYRAGRWNFFLNLDKLEEGDEIYLDVAGYRFVYSVEWIKIVDRYDWEPLETTDTPVITLQTGEPPHVANPDSRLMVRGSLVQVLRVIE